MDRAEPRRTGRRKISDLLPLGCSVWLIALGCYFAFLRPPLLPEDIRFIAASDPSILADPHLLAWLSRVFVVLGGFIACAGALLVLIVRQEPARNGAADRALLLVAGLLGVGAMSAVNFAIESDFRWLLLAPVPAWLAGVWLRRPEVLTRASADRATAAGRDRDVSRPPSR